MFEQIRRAVRRPDRDWQVLEPLLAEPATGYLPEPEVEVGPLPPVETTIPDLGDSRDRGDYYVDLVRTSIAQGGKYGGHEIPVGWLRMILAGLEGMPVDTEAMWESELGQASGDPAELPELQGFGR